MDKTGSRITVADVLANAALRRVLRDVRDGLYDGNEYAPSIAEDLRTAGFIRLEGNWYATDQGRHALKQAESPPPAPLPAAPRGAPLKVVEPLDTMKFQLDATTWAASTFEGRPSWSSRRERMMRFLEEAIELAQAVGLEQADADALVRYVYGRPVGELRQEIGGTMVSFAVLAEVLLEDIGAAATEELRRVNDPAVQVIIRDKQAYKDQMLGPSEPETR